MAYYGTISEINLDAISQSKADNATDVFVYDTSKDSDGGAWRKRTQHLSWYKETLNTATRGSRREFPEIAVIVAQTSTVTIYDGDDPDLPMWMVFQINPYSTGGNLAGIPIGIGYNNNGGLDTHNVSSVCMMNAQLFIGGNTLIHAGWSANFLSEVMHEYLLYPVDASNTSRWTLTGNIAQRNLSQSSTNTPTSRYNPGGSSLGVKSLVNDIAMTVLPNAPIDSATGLAVPTIAVATNGGASVIKDDGTVANITYSTNSSRGVSFDKNNGLWVNFFNNSSAIGWYYYTNFTTTSSLSSIYHNNSSWSGSYDMLGGVFNLGIGYNYSSFSTGTAGLSNFYGFGPVYNSSVMSNYITSTYNTGWMPGNIKSAWLSDTSAVNVTGTELIINGTFDTNTTGWVDYNPGGANSATFQVVSGELQVVENGSANYGIVTQTFSVTAGVSYTVSVTYRSALGIARWFAGTSGGTADVVAVVDTSSTSNITTTRTFTATSTTTLTISLAARNIEGATAYFDNVSIRRAELDRSINNNNLQVFGTVTKSAVATGSNLVAYSGFSTNNYLVQPYNSSLDFGTGDFSIIWWMNSPSTSTDQSIFQQGDYQGGSGIFALVLNSSGNLDSINVGIRGSINFNVLYHESMGWIQMALVRESGVLKVYQNGVLKAFKNNLANINMSSSTVKSFVIGAGYHGGTVNFAYGGSLSLFRISATATSQELIKKMYLDERRLFEPNSQCTLYGSSNNITGLAYDTTTNLLHVGTSSGISSFSGLERVSNTTTAVTTAISASNGLVADQ